MERKLTESDISSSKNEQTEANLIKVVTSCSIKHLPDTGYAGGTCRGLDGNFINMYTVKISVFICNTLN